MAALLRQKIEGLKKQLQDKIHSINDASLDEFMRNPLDDFILSHCPEIPIVQLITYGEKEALAPFIGLDWLEVLDTYREKIKIEDQIFLLTLNEYPAYDLPSAIDPVLLMIIRLPEQKIDEAIREHLTIITKGIPYLKIYSDLNWEKEISLKNILQGNGGKVEFLPANGLTQQNLKDDLMRIGLNQQNFDTLYAFRQLLHFQEVNSLFLQQVQNASFQQNIIQQDIKQKINKNNIEVPETRESQQIRQLIQNRVKGFEGQLIEVLDQEMNPSVGKIAKLINNKIDQLNYLQERKGGKQMRYSIPDDFLGEIMDNFSKSVKDALVIEKDKTITFGQSMENQIDEFLKERGLRISTRVGKLPDESRINQILDTCLVIDRKFEKTASNKKMMEYFMGARMYYMIIFMGLSMFGLSGYMRNLGVYMIPIGILLVGLGVFQVWSGQQKEKDENKIQNLQDARTHIKSQFKKNLQDISRMWEKEVVSAIRDESSRLLDTTEETLNEKERRERNGQQQKKVRLQSIDDGFRQKQRNLESLGKNTTTEENDIKRLKADISTAISKLFMTINKA